MSFKDFLLENYVFVYELVGLLILLMISVHVSPRMKRYNVASVILLMLETIIFEIEKWTQTFEKLSILRPLMTASLYTIYPIILIVIMQVISTHTLSRKKLLILLIPEFISIPLFFTSQWTHLIFYFHEDNRYSGGVPGLSRWPYVLFAFYVVVFVVHNYIFFKSFPKKIILIMSYILIGPLVGVGFYLLTNSGKDYSALFTSGLLLYYVFIYIHMSKLDPLTTLMNRQSYYHDITKNTKSITGVVTADINDLKYYNDYYGHATGDKALVKVAMIFKECTGEGSTAYRVGGDEFVIIYHEKTEEEIKQSIEKMEAKLSETRYRCAFGYAMKQSNERITDTVRVSDSRMYENKKIMKAEKAKMVNEDEK